MLLRNTDEVAEICGPGLCKISNHINQSNYCLEGRKIQLTSSATYRAVEEINDMIKIWAQIFVGGNYNVKFLSIMLNRMNNGDMRMYEGIHSHTNTEQRSLLQPLSSLHSSEPQQTPWGESLMDGGQRSLPVHWLIEICHRELSIKGSTGHVWKRTREDSETRCFSYTDFNYSNNTHIFHLILLETFNVKHHI